jgi:hypothetical protein
MVYHDSLRLPVSNSSQAGDIPRVLSLDSSLSNLSQAETLVGSVSNDDYQPQPQSSPRGSITAHDEPVRRLYPHEPYTLHQNYIDAGLRRQGAAYEVAPDWDRTRQVAHSRVRLLHKQ